MPRISIAVRPRGDNENAVFALAPYRHPMLARNVEQLGQVFTPPKGGGVHARPVAATAGRRSNHRLVTGCSSVAQGAASDCVGIEIDRVAPGRRRSPRLFRLPGGRAVPTIVGNPAMLRFRMSRSTMKTPETDLFDARSNLFPVLHREVRPPPEAGRRAGLHRAARVHQADRCQEAQCLPPARRNGIAFLQNRRLPASSSERTPRLHIYIC